MPPSRSLLRLHRARSLGLLASLILSAVAAPAADAPRYNVLFIAVDDLNDWLGAYRSYPKTLTPHLDRFAQTAMLFDNAHCAFPLCNPSRTAVMTGRHPSRTGIYDNDVWFREVPALKQVVTLPQHFRAKGYRAVAAGKIFHQSSGEMSDPASWSDVPAGRFGGGTPKPPESGQWLHGLRERWPTSSYSYKAFDFAPIEQPKENTQDWQVAEFFAGQLAQPQASPFFFAGGIFRPHLPWYAPREFFEMHPLDGIVLPPGWKENDLADLPPAALKWADTQDHAVIAGGGKWKEALQGYLACISFADACLGRVLDALDASAFRDNTIVVVWGDHGWHLGEKNAWQKPRPWRRTTKVPLLIRVPGMTPPGSRCAAPVSLLDLYPTLNALCGLPARDDLDGRSIAPLLREPDAPWPHAVVTAVGFGNHSVSDVRWRYMRYQNGDEELYDIASDPHEWTNLAAQPAHAGIKQRLSEWLPKQAAKPVSTPEGMARKKSKLEQRR